MDNGKKVLVGQVRLLKVFLSIRSKGCTEYISCLIMSIIIWARQMKLKSTLWTMFKDNASMFNEEAGEVSFSCLARHVARGGVRSEVKQVSDAFVMLKPKMAAAKDLNVTLSGDTVGDKKRYFIDPESEEVQATVAFFKRTIRELQARKYWQYDHTLGNFNGTTSQRKKILFHPPRHRTFLESVTERVDEEIKKAQYFLSSFDVFMHSDIWPSADVQVFSAPVRGAQAAVVHAKNNDHMNKHHDSSYAATVVMEPPNDIAIPEEKVEVECIDTKPKKSKKTKKRRQVGDHKGTQSKKKKGKTAKSRIESYQSLIQEMGTIIHVPAWKWGHKWAKEAFDDPKRAYLHMKVIEINSNKISEPFLADFVDCNRDSWPMRFERVEIDRWRCLDGPSCPDTPYNVDYCE